MKSSVVKHFAVIMVALFIFTITYGIHSDYDYKYRDARQDGRWKLVEENNVNYPFPLHSDEWINIALSKQIIKEGKITDINPYTGKGGEIRSVFESGFHVFLAEFSLLTGLDIILNYKYLAAIFAALSSIALFLLVMELTKKFIPSILSMIFFSAIKSQAGHFLGTWFFVPFTMSIPLMYFCTFCFIKGIENKGYLACAAIIWLSILLLHPFSAIFLGIVLLAYTLFNKEYRSIVKHRIVSSLIGIGIFTAMFIYFFIHHQKFFSSVSFIYKIPPEGLAWSGLLLPNLFISILYIILGLIGFLTALISKKTGVFAIWLGLAIVNLVLFFLTEYTLLVPIHRNTNYLMFALAPLAALGLYILLQHAFNIINSVIKLPNAKKIAITVCILLILPMLYFTFNKYDEVTSENVLLYHLIEQEDYDAIKWIKSKYQDIVILSPTTISTTIYPIIGEKVVGLPPGLLTWGGSDAVIVFYFFSDCPQKKEIITANNVNLIISKNIISCDFLQEEYNEGNTRIYSIA